MVRSEFVDDLIPLILDAYDHWWPCHLAKFALVSPTWLFYTQRRLYSHPDIHTFSAARRLEATLADNPYLASLVKAISLQPAWYGGRGHARALSSAAKVIRSLVGLDGLRRISFGGYVADNAAIFLRLIANPDLIEELHICGHESFASSTVFEWDESFTFGFPNLKKLRLSYMELCVMPPSVPYPAPFTHVILENVDFKQGNILQLLNGTTSLDCLHVTSSACSVGEPRLVLLSGCALGCLHFESNYPVRRDLFQDLDARHGEAVRCLHLDGCFLDMGILAGWSEIFGNLEELGVSGRYVRVLSKEWVQFINSGALPSLRQLFLPFGRNSPPFVAWTTAEKEEIRAACGSKGIDLVYT